LEGVLFKAFYEDGQLKVESVEDWDSNPYLSGLNKDLWLTEALSYVQSIDVVSCPHCGNDVAIE